MRIESLPTEKERGDAFEVFVEAFLNTDEIAQAETVWCGGNVPGEIRTKLNLPSRDYGIDGVFRTKLGELVGYQVKFRTSRKPLPYADLATFFGLSERCDRRIVLTNSIAISAVAESRTSFQTTRGGDFDRLDAAQLAVIAAWIEGVPPAFQKREPHPHQLAALSDIAAELLVNDRATAVMACGTGKTLLGLWVAEAVAPKSVLVLVPSLNLLRQTLHEWAKWTNWGPRFRYLCVCSDPKVDSGLDEIEIQPEDADFPVRTDPVIVSRFLDAGDTRANTVSVIFCTYQSAPIIGQAMKGRPAGLRFDIGIFDEAHKTVGRGGARYAYALLDKNIPIRKRLFVTATPRHINIGKKDAEDDFAVVSMDDETIYGRVAHHLTFAKAVAVTEKIIVPYRVVISVVDSEMIDNALLNKSEVVIGNDPLKAKWVARQIALKRAIEEHDLKRVITFHSSIKAAAQFASREPVGIGTHLPSFSCFHVSGAQPTAERSEQMREFAQARRGIVTNARCLTEGVDVPSVDMVAFMNPRKSRVDIVQAVGRAMRSSPEKTCGYVLLPLFLDIKQGETLDEALDRSKFDEIAHVLNAIRDNDEQLDDLIRELAIEKGKTGGFDETRLSDKIEVLGPQIYFARLASAIGIRLVDKLCFTWDQWYGMLLAYVQKEGHSRVHLHYKDEAGYALGGWVSHQRECKDSMDSRRRQLLEELPSWSWNSNEDKWQEQFDQLKEFSERHQHCRIPRANKKLYAWIGNQRQKMAEMSLTRQQLLEGLPGWTWDAFDEKWEKRYLRLREYATIHKTCYLPFGFADLDGYALQQWADVQRRRKDKLSSDCINRIESLPGWSWRSALEEQWERGYARLEEYVAVTNSALVPKSFICDDGFKLGQWVSHQRSNKEKLPDEAKNRLEGLPNWSWSKLADQWSSNYENLRNYAAIHGDSLVPLRYESPEHGKLGNWVRNQRRGKNTMSLERQRLLEALPGWAWDAHHLAANFKGYKRS